MRLHLPSLLLAFALLPACGDKSDDTATPDDTGASGDTDDTDDTDDTGEGPDTDRDGDGYEDHGAGGADCDDADPDIHPGADEVCDGVDNDCDGRIDPPDSVDAPTWYADSDGDGYGDPATGEAACTAPPGGVADATDCDDAASGVNPGATEVCDDADVDEDCSGAADDADSGVTGQGTWYTDSDGDGYGDAASSTTACDQPSGSVADATDCDDTASGVNPGAVEVCDASDVDEDCSGAADDADAGVTGQGTWYTDSDGDGYGDAASSTTSCDAPSGSVADDSDCDDDDALTYPGATELCDGIQNDCDDAAWTDDAGLASLVDSAGAWSDLTATLGAGTSGSVASYTIADGATVQVCEGTWYAGLSFDGDGELVGIGSDVVLDGDDSARLVYASQSGAVVRLENLVLQNGTASGGTAGGIYARYLDSIELDTVSVTDCVAGYAGGAYFADIASVTWTDVDFRGNEATSNNGGGVVISSVTSLTGAGVGVSENLTPGSGGGLLTSGSSTVVDLADLNLSDNLAGDYGGGWYVTGGSVTLDGCTIDGNASDRDGGGITFSGAVLDLTDCTVSTNESAYGAGIMQWAGSTFTGDTVVFDQNVASGDAAAVYLETTASMDCADCDFTDNTSGRSAITVDSGGSLDISNGDFSGNTTLDVYSGGNYTYGTAETFTCDGSSCL